MWARTSGSTRVDQRVGVVIGRIEHEPAPGFLILRRLHEQLHHEAVAGGSGDLEGFLLLDPVAIREDRQMGKAVLAVEGIDAALGHHPQEERVHLRAGAIDLVEEEHRELRAVLEERTGIDARLSLLADVRVVDEIVGHEVDGALDPLVGAADATRHRPQQGRLADADIPLQQHVTTREDGDRDLADQRVQADHRLPHLLLELQRPVAPVLEKRVVSIHRIGSDRLHATVGRR